MILAGIVLAVIVLAGALAYYMFRGSAETTVLNQAGPTADSAAAPMPSNSPSVIGAPATESAPPIAEAEYPAQTYEAGADSAGIFKVESRAGGDTMDRNAPAQNSAAVAAKIPPAPIPKPTLTLSASPSTVTLGETATLRWDSADATRVTIDHGVMGNSLSGTEQVQPREDTTYTATAEGAGGMIRESITVRVVDPVPSILTIPVNTPIALSLTSPLDTKRNKKGDEFTASVNSDVRVGKYIAIPRGSVVRGVLGEVKRAGVLRGRAELNLRFKSIELPDGTTKEIAATLAAADTTGNASLEGEEGAVQGGGSGKRTAVGAAAGAGAGAVIGAVAGGGKGAGAGGAAGAATGALGAMLTRERDIKMEADTVITIEMDRELELPPQNRR